MYLPTDRMARRVTTSAAVLAMLIGAGCAWAGQVQPAPPSLHQAGSPISSRPPSLTHGPQRQPSKAANPRSEAEEIIAEANHYFRMAELTVSKEQTREQYYARVEELAERALSLDADSAQAHFLLFAVRGRRLLSDGVQMTEVWQFPKLNHHLKRTLELDPNHAHALAARGGLLLDLPALMGGDPEAAVEYLERALALNPMGLRTRVTLARALMRRQEYRQARQQLLTAAHYACRLGRRSVVDEAEKLLADLDANAEAGAEANGQAAGLGSLPWQPRTAEAATTPASGR